MIDFEPQNKRGCRVLLTPGPLTTTRTVRQAMLDDLGSWDQDMIDLVREIRDELVRLANSDLDLTCTLVQGSGTFGVESMVGSVIPKVGGRLLILINGAYGRRIQLISAALGINHVTLEDPEDCPHDPSRVEAALASDPSITHVVCVHCETTTGLVNPLREIGLAVARQNRRFLVDAISTFAAYGIGKGESIDFEMIDHISGSANKCVEGVPGFAFVISRRSAVEATEGNGRSISLDLYEQWKSLEQTGKFRFTPPTHVLLAFRQALRELEQEGGVPARQKRYELNHRTLVEGMKELGFDALIPAEHQSHIITTFLYPNDDFNFTQFYNDLRAKGFIIYPGKLTIADTFRVGNIGSIGPEEIRGLLKAVGEVMAEKTAAKR